MKYKLLVLSMILTLAISSVSSFDSKWDYSNYTCNLTVINGSFDNITMGENIKFKAVIFDQYGNPVKAGKVKVSHDFVVGDGWDSAILNLVTNENGTIFFNDTFTKLEGSLCLDLNGTLLGYNYFRTIPGGVPKPFFCDITVNPDILGIGNNKFKIGYNEFKAFIFDQYGNPVKAGETVNIIVGDKKYKVNKTLVSDEKGIINFNTTFTELLPESARSVAFVYFETNERTLAHYIFKDNGYDYVWSFFQSVYGSDWRWMTCM
ncbi:MAG: hypothetical protein LBT10_02545 [Methanobrevibacter sp.]|jgi:hypothetical protein|nr:hypothetical protein [Methanobrevibacter sp.]